jgi:hypothetical protein
MALDSVTETSPPATRHEDYSVITSRQPAFVVHLRKQICPSIACRRNVLYLKIEVVGANKNSFIHGNERRRYMVTTGRTLPTHTRVVS